MFTINPETTHHCLLAFFALYLLNAHLSHHEHSTYALIHHQSLSIKMIKGFKNLLIIPTIRPIL